MRNILIIGASGYIGSKLYYFLRQRGDHVIGTYHKLKPDQSLIQYDMEQDDIISLCKSLGSDYGALPRESHAIISAGESKISNCKDNYEAAYKLNVTATQNTIQKLSEVGYHVIYCSTDNVYDGVQGDYTETDAIHPVNEYGKMKAAVEEYMLHHCPTACIIRLSKVVGIEDSKQDMLKEWKDAALMKKDIYVIKGNYFNPININDVVLYITRIIDNSLSGIYNICGDTKYTRAELCRKFLDATGLQAKVFEKPFEEFGFNDNRPLDTSMRNQKIADTIGKGLRLHGLEDCFSLYK